MQEDSRPQRGGRGRPQSGGLDRRDSSSYQPRNGIAKRGNYPLDTFHVHQLVLARNVNRPQPFWPAIVVEPSKEAPEIVRRQMQPGKLCVMFYGPAANKATCKVAETGSSQNGSGQPDIYTDGRSKQSRLFWPCVKIRPRDFCWASEGDVVPLTDYIDDLKKSSISDHGRGDAFSDALREVLLVERGEADPLAGSATDHQAGRGGGSHARRPACKSCAIALDDWEMQNSAAFGGRCENCEQLHKEGNFCPVCDKVWLPTDKNMAGCDNCSFWVHDHCDPLASVALHAPSDIPFYCAPCKRQAEAHAKLTALRQAEAQLRAAQPRRPRSAYHLFSMELNKQYTPEQRMISVEEMARVVGETWKSLSPAEKQPYEAVAQAEMAAFLQNKRAFEVLHRQYSALHYAAQEAGFLDEMGAPVDFSARPQGPPAPLLTLAAVHRATSKASSSSAAAAAATAAAAAAAAAAQPVPRRPASSVKKRPAEDDWSDEDEEPEARPRKQLATGRAADTGEVIQRIPVFCNGMRGVFLLGRQRIVCLCSDCGDKAEASRMFSCTQFEMHCGAGAAKKWKASLRIEPGGVPEVKPGGPSMPIGKWLVLKGYEPKPGSNKAAQNSLPSRQAPAPTPPPREIKPPKEEKAPKEEKPFEPWLDTLKGDFKPIQVRWAGDRCSVCDSDVDFDFDQLVSCDACGITVHQSCYGVADLPGVDDMWLCRACELKEKDAKPPQCCLCPVTGGALKPSTDKGLWAHAACMQWIPEVSVEDVTRMEPVSHIKSIQKERWDLLCVICKQRVGAKIQCTSCYTAYHPLCARIAGLHMEILDGEGGPDAPVRLVSYCPKHCTAHPELSGVQRIKDGEAAEDRGDEGTGLWNAQPFKQPPAVPLPDCPAGCIRAQPILEGWERVSHGTGTGHSTISAFWIPDKLPPPPEKPKAAHRGSGGGHASAKLKTHAAFGGKGKRFSSRPAKKASARSGDAAAGPPEYAELVQLPENVPEEVPVTCAGRSAVLNIRSQIVTFGGQRMSASRFETVCGKGDAKKWKCSIWLEGPDGSQEQVMQDWLNERKLDRKALTALSTNLAAVEAWEEYMLEEAEAVVRSLVAAVAREPEEGEVEEDGSERPHGGSVSASDADDGEAQAGAAAEDMEAAAGASGATAAMEDADGIGATSSRTNADISEDGPVPHEGTPPSLAKGDLSRADGPSSAGTHEDVGMLERSTTDAVHGDGALAAANGYMDVDVTPTETSFLTSLDGEEQPAGPDRIGGQPTVIKEEAASANGTGPEGAATGGEATECKAEADLAAPLVSPYGLRRREAAAAAAAAAMIAAAAGRRAPSADTKRAGSAEKEAAGQLPAAPAKPQRQRPTARNDSRKEPGLEDVLLERIYGSRDAAAARPRSGPEARVGQRCRVFWRDDQDWYEAVCRGFDPAKRMHNLWYIYDEEEEWLDTETEERFGRLRWLAADDAVAPSASEAAGAADAGPRVPLPEGNAALGCRIGVWWIDDAQYYHGTVKEFDPETGKHLVLYDDGDKEWLSFQSERVTWLKNEPPPATEPVEEAMEEDAPEDQAPAPRKPAADIPSHVPCCCGSMRGRFDVARTCVILEGGREVSPTEFERLAGKAASKKWKASIRIDKGGGTPGMTMGDWLVDKGLDAPRAARPKAPSLNALRRRQGQQFRSAPFGPPHASASTSFGKQGHRDGCMCVICKQARRSGRPWAGMVPGDPYWAPGGGGSAPGARSAAGPPPRLGKRAFVRAVPQLAGNLRLRMLAQLPSTRCLTMEEFEAAQRKQSEGADPEELTADAVEAEEEEEQQQGAHRSGSAEREGNGVSNGGGKGRRRKGPTLKERLMRCLRTERERVTFGKSGIHGWGLFARKAMKADSMVIEYRGDVLRRTTADAREKRYQMAGKDCYLFTVQDDFVIDATMRGGIGRFTNHCCAPSMYTKVLEIDGVPRLVFFARFDLVPGQELTYDYRFKEEDGDNKLPCGCGAPNCRGTLN